MSSTKNRNHCMAKRVLKICCYTWLNASRDKRELSACQELGMKVEVLAKGEGDECGHFSKMDGFDVFKVSTRPFPHFPIFINRFFSIGSFVLQARKMNPDIISGHDMIGVFVGWLSNVLRSHKATLVYDSHEFELGRNTKRSKFQTWIVARLERFLIKRCAFSIMVNDAIADEVQRIHKLSNRPVVVRSTPNLWHINEQDCRKTRQQILSTMSTSRDVLLMYHGGVIPGRGIETLLEVVSKTDFTCVIILGNGQESYIQTLKIRAESLGISGRVLFHPAVPINELWRYVGAADIGMVTIPAVAKSYYYMLPNKFFENIQSETPVICSNFPAIAPIVNKYNIGLTCDPTDVHSIIASIKRMVDDKGLYQTFKSNLKKAKLQLCWENEKQGLMSAYKELI